MIPHTFRQVATQNRTQSQKNKKKKVLLKDTKELRSGQNLADGICIEVCVANEEDVNITAALKVSGLLIIAPFKRDDNL